MNRDAAFAEAARLVLARSRATEPEPVAAFLARHAELREWLEPMLALRDDGDGNDESTAAAGDLLGPYRLLREIGRGGVGVVHEARLGDGPTPIALKVLAGFRALQPARAERFRREAALAAKLAHPGLVRVLDSGATGDTLWLAMEFVVGAPLDAVLQELQGRDPAALTGEDLERAVLARLHLPRDASRPAATAFAGTYTAAIAQLALRLADALADLHAAGVIHRDVKPSNILLCPDGRVVLTDFGLARDAVEDSLTMTGDFAGTPNYVSPEQSMAKRVAVDHRSDLFSFGSTLYELLTLQKAFAGDSLPAVLGRILAKEPPPPDRVHRGLSPDLATVLGKLLEKDPERRYANAEALAADLRAFLEYRSVAAQRASTWRRLQRWVRREPLRAALVGMIAATVPTLAAGGGYLWARADEIRAGREQLRARQVHDLVDAGFIATVHEDHVTANACFEQGLALDPHDPEAAMGLVLAMMHHDGPAAALHTFEQRFSASMPEGLRDTLRFDLRHRAGTADPGAPSPEPRTALELFLAGSLDYGEFRGAERICECMERAVLASDRPRLWLHLQWAMYADAAQDHAACRRCAENLLAKWPESPAAIYFACLALRRSDPERALRIARDATARRPREGALHWAVATVLEQQSDLAGATTAMTTVVELLPTMAAAHYTLGRLWFERGEPAQALPAMQRARDLSPLFVEAWMGIGMVQRRLGDTGAAIAALQRAVELHGSHSDARFQLGQVLAQCRRTDEALEQLRRAATISGDDPNKWHHVAFVLFQSGDDAGGAEALHRAVACRPGHERSHSVMAMFLQERGTPAELRQALAAWVREVPNSVDGWLQYGQHCVRADLDAGMQDAATAAWAGQRVLALAGESHAAGWLLLGEARTALGQPELARTALQRALAAKPELPAADRERVAALLASLPHAATPADAGR